MRVAFVLATPHTQVSLAGCSTAAWLLLRFLICSSPRLSRVLALALVFPAVYPGLWVILYFSTNGDSSFPGGRLRGNDAQNSPTRPSRTTSSRWGQLWICDMYLFVLVRKTRNNRVGL